MIYFIMKSLTSISILFLFFSLQACVPLSYSRNRSRTILWQAGADFSSINKMSCLARTYDIAYIQTFRFLELTQNLNDTNIHLLSSNSLCTRDIFIILYIGPTRDQLKVSKDKTYWLMYNYKIFKKNVNLYNQFFGSNNIILQLYDEPSNATDISIINSFCKSNPNPKYFLSTNTRSLRLFDKLMLNCFILIDYHNYGTSQRYPQLFTKQVNSFLSKLQNRYTNYFSITLPLFKKLVKQTNKIENRIFDSSSHRYLIRHLKVKPSYYGAYLAPNIGFMQDNSLYLNFQNINFINDIK